MRKKLLLLFVFLFLVFSNNNIVSARCYEFCEGNNCRTDTSEFKCYQKTYIKSKKNPEYYVAKANEPIKKSSAYETNSLSMDYCLDNIKGSKLSEVNDEKCKNTNSGKYVYCGNIGKIPKKIPELTSWFITLIEIIVPVILVIMGTIDFVKAITSQKEDEIKKGQQTFIKRLIVAVIIFFVVAIVKLLVGLVSSGPSESKNIIDCIECFLNFKCS